MGSSLPKGYSCSSFWKEAHFYACSLFFSHSLPNSWDNQINLVELEHAHVERKAFGLFRDGYFEQAIAKLDKICLERGDLDQLSKGWLLQFAARIAFYWGSNELSQKFQQQAYANNHNLMRPQSISSYEPLTKPGKQAEAIVREICQFQFRRGFIAEFEEEVSHLVPNATANQFEQALENLGSKLGFRTERPDKIYGKGPDVLWLLDDSLGLVIEAKSRKNSDNALTKDQHGQLLNAAEWFHEKYPRYTGIRVSLHPNVNVTKSTVPGESKALTLSKLNKLIADARALFVELCESLIPPDELIVRCENLLATSTLKPNSLLKEYLVPFDLSEN